MVGPFLILHKVRGEPAFDIAILLDSANGEECWIIPTSGHRAYPYQRWSLEELVDVSDINMNGQHNRPYSFQYAVLPEDWPDHYQVKPAPATAKSTGRRAIAFLRSIGTLPTETNRRA